MRIAFAVFVFIHAVAHAVGFISLSGIAEVEGVDGRASLVFDHLEPGSTALKVLSLIWVVGVAGFAVAGIGLLRETDWVIPVLVVMAILSLVACILWYRDTPFGIVANVIILAVVLVPALDERLLPA